MWGGPPDVFLKFESRIDQSPNFGSVTVIGIIIIIFYESVVLLTATHCLNNCHTVCVSVCMSVDMSVCLCRYV